MTTKPRSPSSTGPHAGLADVRGVRPDVAGGPLDSPRIVAESAAMRAVLARAAPVARSEGPVVILGETGTGKEILARAIHASSPRAAGPFVVLDCAALPADAMERELFGDARGVLAGGRDRSGMLLEADRGTLLLDDVPELPLALQGKLLRVLQGGELRRAGASHPLRTDVRVIATTRRPLRQLVERGAFRADLYYRLRVFELVLPPVRERLEDVLPIARDVLRGLAGAEATFAADAEHDLVTYRWPGNVRELVNAVRHGVALAEGGPVRRDDLPEDVRAAARSGGRAGAAAPERLRSLAEVEREHILATVEACHGNHSEAARVLGIGRNTLWRKLEAYREEDARRARSA